MKSSLTFKEALLVFFGLGYCVNHRSREVHRISKKHMNCHLHLIADQNREFCSKKHAKHLIKDCGYNGCRWCWNPMDNG